MEDGMPIILEPEFILRMLCALILYVSGGTYSLTPTPCLISKKLFHARFIYSQSICQKSNERKSPKNFLFSCFDAIPRLPRFEEKRVETP